jgi:hypothetical protein
MSKKVVENFVSIFKALSTSADIKVEKFGAAEKHVYVKKFAKVQGILKAYATNKRLCAINKLSIFDLVDRAGKLHPEFLLYINGYYEDHPSTLNSQVSLISTLTNDELVAASKIKFPAAEPPDSEPYDLEELPEYLREIYIALPRVVQGGQSQTPEARLKLPLKNISRDIFNILLKLNKKYEVSTAGEMLVGRHEEIVWLFRERADRSDWKDIFWVLHKTRSKLGLVLREASNGGSSPDKLPVKLQEWLDNYIANAERGIGADKHLTELARANKFKHLAGHAPMTIFNNRRKFLWGVSRLTLTPEMEFVDLMRLEERKVLKNSREYTVFVNPHAEIIRTAEREKERRGFKKAGYDSSTFVSYRRAVCAISRFNGEFELAQEFADAYKAHYDTESNPERTLLKKLSFTREWVDGEIEKLAHRFFRYVKTKAFLVDEEALSLCVFFPLLLTCRYLGFRQQCPRKSDIGKHIIFGKDGSITIHYDKGEVKNRRLIHIVLTDESHDGMEEIKMLMDVLKTYKKGVLDVIRNKYEEQYRRDVGAAFFVKVKQPKKNGLIEKYGRGDVSNNVETFAKAELNGICRLSKYFEKNLYRFLDCERLRSFPYHFNIHFLRGLCCDWMIKKLKYTWEQVAKALGDKVDTLKKHYYHEEEYVVDPGEAFAMTSEQRRTEKAIREGGGPVSTESWQALQREHQAALIQRGRVEERAESAEKRAEKAERDAAALRDENKLLLAQIAELQAAQGGLCVAGV